MMRIGLMSVCSVLYQIRKKSNNVRAERCSSRMKCVSFALMINFACKISSLCVVRKSV